MSNLCGKSLLALGATLAIGITAFGCGGDSKKSSSEGTGGSRSATGGTGTSAGGTSGIGNGMGSGGTGTGGSVATGTGAAPAIPMPMCDKKAPAKATCGGTACPAPSAAAALVCSVPCCTADDECGTQIAMLNAPKSTCTAPAAPDANCPDYTGTVMGETITLRGCCHADGVCGAITTINMTCITSSMRLTDPLLKPGAPCGGSSDPDAGM